MLLGERRDVVDFWLAHEDYHGLLEDHDAGLLDEEAFHAKVTAWTRRFEADGRREGFIADPEEKPRAATPLQLQAPLDTTPTPDVHAQPKQEAQMTRKEELARIEWDYATGQIDYEQYRSDIKALWAKKEPTSRSPDCALEFNPEPGIAVRTTLTRGGGMSR